jgi:hypothetical protein
MRFVGRLRLNEPHLPDEPDPLPRHGLYQPLLLATVTNGTPRRINAAVERRLRNDPFLPDRGEQVVLADHPLAVADQVGKKIEYLRLDGSSTSRLWWPPIQA